MLFLLHAVMHADSLDLGPPLVCFHALVLAAEVNVAVDL